MRWLTQNWFFLIVGVLFVLMHLGHGGYGGHGGHGGHGTPRRDENGGEPPEPGARDPRAGHRH